MDRRVGADGFRRVMKSTGVQINLGGAPMEPCDTLEASSVELTGNELLFVKNFEMMAPIFDYAMFAPDDLSTMWA